MAKENEVNENEQQQLTAEEFQEAMICGILELEEPITTGEGETVTELKYDFNRIKSTMLMAALKADKTVRTDMQSLTDTQALELFYRAVAPEENKNLSIMDMRAQLSVGDAIFAMQLASAFFGRKWASGIGRIKKR